MDQPQEFQPLNPNLWSEEVSRTTDDRLRRFEDYDRRDAVKYIMGDWVLDDPVTHEQRAGTFSDLLPDDFDELGLTRTTQTPFSDAVRDVYNETWNDQRPDNVWWNDPTDDNPTMRMPTRDRIPRWQREEQTKFLNQLLEEHDPDVRAELYGFAARAPDDTRSQMLGVLNVPAGTIMDMVKFYEKLIREDREPDVQREKLMPCINALLRLENWRGYEDSMPAKVIEYIEKGGQPGSFVNELNHLLTRTYRQLSFYIRDHDQFETSLADIRNPRITSYMNKRRRRLARQAAGEEQRTLVQAEVEANVENLVNMLRSTRFLPRSAREVIARVLTAMATGNGRRRQNATQNGLEVLLESGLLSQETVDRAQLTPEDQAEIQRVATRVIEAIQDKIIEQQDRNRTRSPRVTVDQVRQEVDEQIALVTESTIARVKLVLREVDTKLKQKMNPHVVDLVFDAINQALVVSEPSIKERAVADAKASVTLAGTQPSPRQSPNRSPNRSAGFRNSNPLFTSSSPSLEPGVDSDVRRGDAFFEPSPSRSNSSVGSQTDAAQNVGPIETVELDLDGNFWGIDHNGNRRKLDENSRADQFHIDRYLSQGGGALRRTGRLPPLTEDDI